MTSQEFNFLEFMGLVNIFRKKKMKNARFPKTSLSVQIGEEIWAPVCSDYFIQLHTNTSKTGSKPNFTNHTYFISLYIETSEHNVAYTSSQICTNRLIFR